MPTLKPESTFRLPAPSYDGSVSLEQTLSARRSVRSFSPDSLSLEKVSQLLWAAQGISSPRGYRTAPSAGALYPLEVYTIIGNVDNLIPGIYKYIIREHALKIIEKGDHRNDICRAALNQSFIVKAPLVMLFCTVDDRVTNKYGTRGLKYIYMEIGHAAQNVCLQAVALGLGTVVIGAFSDKDIAAIVNLPENELPAYLIPIGGPKNVPKFF